MARAIGQPPSAGLAVSRADLMEYRFVPCRSYRELDHAVDKSKPAVAFQLVTVRESHQLARPVLSSEEPSPLRSATSLS